MQIDQSRIRAICQAEHAYYGEVDRRIDARWYPAVSDMIRSQLSPEMRVLDVGCGDGSMLLELCPSFHSGAGIDYDPEHIRLAEEAKSAQGVQNVDFFLLDFYSETGRFQPESFDMVYSMRGPLTDTPQGIRAALRLLRPGGLLLCEEIGELHQHEVSRLFGISAGSEEIRVVNRVKTMLEREGVDVRLAIDVFTKWIYPDVYAWFQYQCNIWTWCGIPLPEADDPRIDLFGEQHTNAAGEVVTTHHIARVAGVKAYNK